MKNRKYPPAGWKLVKLGDVCELVYGESLPHIKRVKGLVPVYGSNGIVGHHNAALSDKPTIIIGRKGSVGEVHYSATKCWIIDTAYFVRPHAEVDMLFLFYMLKNLKLNYLNKSTAVPGLNREDVYRLSVYLPSLNEQRRIAALIRRQLEAVEKARKATQEQLEAANDLRAAMTYQLLLVDNFPRVPLGQICDVKGGKRLPKGTEFSSQVTNHPYIRVTDFENDSINLNDLKYISDEVHHDISKYIINRNDVYISIAGTIGKCGTIPECLDGANLTENAARCILDSSRVDKSYLVLFLMSTQGQSQIQSRTNIVGQPKLALERIKTIEIPLPSLEEQYKIAATITEKIAVILKIKTIVKEQLDAIKTMPDAILRIAFNGEI